MRSTEFAAGSPESRVLQQATGTRQISRYQQQHRFKEPSIWGSPSRLHGSQHINLMDTNEGALRAAETRNVDDHKYSARDHLWGTDSYESRPRSVGGDNIALCMTVPSNGTVSEVRGWSRPGTREQLARDLRATSEARGHDPGDSAFERQGGVNSLQQDDSVVLNLSPAARRRRRQEIQASSGASGSNEEVDAVLRALKPPARMEDTADTVSKKARSSCGSVCFSHEDIDERDVHLLCQALSQPYAFSVRVLDLHGAKLSDVSTYKIAEMLGFNKGIRSLSLCGCLLGERGIKSLGAALALNKTLYTLDLSASFLPLTTDCAESLARGLKANRSLTSLNLSANRLKDFGALHIIQSVRKHPSLELIDVSANEISDEGALQFSMGMDINPTLRTVLIGQNSVKNAGCDAILGSFGKVIKTKVESYDTGR